VKWFLDRNLSRPFGAGKLTFLEQLKSVSAYCYGHILLLFSFVIMTVGTMYLELNCWKYCFWEFEVIIII